MKLKKNIYNSKYVYIYCVYFTYTTRIHKLK